MGEVFLAEDASLGRLVAVKVLGPAVLRDRTAMERFRREASAMALLAHASIVRVYESGEADEGPYLVLEFVDGGSLAALLHEGPLSLPAAVELVAGVAEGLAAIHEAGLVHRDLKPSNVLLTAQGEPKIADFGLVRFDAQARTALTRTGQVVGTLPYLPPEALQGRPQDRRGDVYQLGVLLYQCLTGRLPLNTAQVGALARGETVAVPPPSRCRPAVDAELDALVLEATAWSAEARRTSAAAIGGRCRAWLTRPRDRGTATQPLPPVPQPSTGTDLRPPATSPHRRRLVAASTALLLAGYAAGAWRRPIGASDRPELSVSLREVRLVDPRTLELRCAGSMEGDLSLSFRAPDGRELPDMPRAASLSKARPGGGETFWIRMTLTAPLHRPCILSVGTAAKATFVVDPTVLPGFLAEALRRLRGPRALAAPFKALDTLRSNAANGRAPAGQAEEVRRALGAAGLDAHHLADLQTWLPTLLSRPEEPAALARQLEPLLFLEAALGDPCAPPLPWGWIGAGLGLTLTPQLGRELPRLPTAVRVLTHVKLRGDAQPPVATAQRPGSTRRWLAPSPFLERHRALMSGTPLYALEKQGADGEEVPTLGQIRTSFAIQVEVPAPLPTGAGTLLMALRARGFPREQVFRVALNGVPGVPMANVSGVAGTEQPLPHDDWIIVAPLDRRALKAGQNFVSVGVEVVAERYTGGTTALSDLWLLWRPR